MVRNIAGKSPAPFTQFPVARQHNVTVQILTLMTPTGLVQTPRFPLYLVVGAYLDLYEVMRV